MNERIVGRPKKKKKERKRKGYGQRRAMKTDGKCVLKSDKKGTLTTVLSTMTNGTKWITLKQA